MQSASLFRVKITHHTLFNGHPIRHTFDGIVSVGTTMVGDIDSEGRIIFLLSSNINQFLRFTPTHGVAVNECRPRDRLHHLIAVQVFNAHRCDVHRCTVNVLRQFLQFENQFVVLGDEVETKVTYSTLCFHRSTAHALPVCIHLARRTESMIRYVHILLLFSVPLVIEVVHREFHLGATACDLLHILIEWDVCQESRLCTIMTHHHALLHHVTRQCHVPEGDFVDIALHAVIRRKLLFITGGIHLAQTEWCGTIQSAEAHCLILSCQFAIHIDGSHIGWTIHHERQLMPLIVIITLVHQDGRRIATDNQSLVSHTNEEFLLGIRFAFHTIT